MSQEALGQASSSPLGHDTRRGALGGAVGSYDLFASITDNKESYGSPASIAEVFMADPPVRDPVDPSAVRVVMHRTTKII